MQDFDYLDPKDVYLDSACQSLRPRPVIKALADYYENFNSCGERVKYEWGKITDEKVMATRRKILKYLKLSPRDYFVSFTLNTTYGLNLILSQISPKGIDKIITSDIEHNSPFLSTIAFSKRHDIPREVISRKPDGSVPLDLDYTNSLVVLNCASNVDGRKLENLKDLIKKVHKQKGTIIIDAAQAMAHSSDILHKTDADAICFSAHKMYAPSLGVMVVKKSLLPRIETSFIGGGMVDDVEKDSYTLSSTNPDHIHTKLESGLQAWGEIIALGAAIDWLEDLPKSAHTALERNASSLFDFLGNHPKVHLVNRSPNPTTSFYVEGLDSHLLGSALAAEGIMARTGYFCVHYYLDHVMKYPPLIRFSLGHHNTEHDLERVKDIISRL